MSKYLPALCYGFFVFFSFIRVSLLVFTNQISLPTIPPFPFPYHFFPNSQIKNLAVCLFSMISFKIVWEFCATNDNPSSITLDLLPAIDLPRRNVTFGLSLTTGDMADLLHKAISSMTIEDEAPLTLPDEPRFRVVAENECSLLGRLLNPDCQIMARMIDYMPIAWRIYGRVRGIALSRDRFQFVFQREEDLVTVLKDRPWSYNRWAMTLERWTPSPPPRRSSCKLWRSGSGSVIYL